MLDVTLSVLALIAGGVTIELFSPAARLVVGSLDDNSPVPNEDFQTGNPS
jgi:hypothetical protein